MTDAQLTAFAEARYAAALASGDASERAFADLLRRLLTAWRKARREAFTATQGDGAPVDTASLDTALGAVARALGTTFGAASTVPLLDATDDAYWMGRDGVSAAISFTEVDERAISWLHRNQTYFAGTMYDRTLSDAVRAAGEDVVRRRLPRMEAGQAFAQALEGITGARASAYWEGFSVVTVSRAQEFGRTEGYARTGTEAVIIDAVNDRRTSCQCKFLDGKRLNVAALVEQRDAMVAATDPAAIKTLAPWPTCENVARLYAEGRIGLPPYHSSCRTRTRVLLDTDG